MEKEEQEKIIRDFAGLGIEKDDIFREIMRAHRVDYILFSDRNNAEYGVTEEVLYEGMKRFTEKELGEFPGDSVRYGQVYILSMSANPMDFVDMEMAEDRTSMELLIREIILHAKESGDTVLFAGAESYMKMMPEIFDSLSMKRIAVAVSDPLWKKRLQFLYPQGKFIIMSELQQDQTKYDYIFYFSSRAAADKLQSKYQIMEYWKNLADRTAAGGQMDAVLPQVLMNHPGKKIEQVRNEMAARMILSSYYHVSLGKENEYVVLTTEDPNKEGTTVFGEMGISEGQLVLADKETTERKNFAISGTWDYDFWVYTQSGYLRSLFSSGRLDMSFCIGEVFQACRNVHSGTGNGPHLSVTIGDLDGAGIKEDLLKTAGAGDDCSCVPIQKGDLLVTVRGSAFKTAVVPDSLKNASVSSNLLVLRPSDIYTAEYLKMYLDGPVGREFIRVISTGSTRLNIRPDRVLRIPLLKAEPTVIRRITNRCSAAVGELEAAGCRWRAVERAAAEEMGGYPQASGCR